jgi:GalNAc5-diNAcBac-PP-undecaprenol beta-1,3-glucosyltransferase
MKVTVLIPTFDHCELVRYPIESVLNQTHQDFELFVIGDGAPELTQEIVESYAGHDSRITYFNNPKGERNGELHRHAALSKATGDAVAYLSDDDLYLPNHLSLIVDALKTSEFVHTRTFDIRADGTLWPFPITFSRPFYRELLLSGHNRIPLSMGAHTMELYRRLPYGWRTTPRPIYTDLYMWQQILAATESVRSLEDISVLHFSSPERKMCTQEERVLELRSYAEIIADTDRHNRLVESFEQQLQGLVYQIDEYYLQRLSSKDSEISELKAQWHIRMAEAQSNFVDLERHLALLTSGKIYRWGAVLSKQLARLRSL